jgi:hypothetical protein
MRHKPLAAVILTATLMVCLPIGWADTLELADGTVIKDCYVRDEGVRVTVWESLDQVGRPPKVYPRSQVKEWKVERGEDWDRHPDLPDLTVTYIEIAPKLAGLHGRVQYDQYGAPWIGGDSKLLIDRGDQKLTDPEGAVWNLKLRYQPGEEITLTAHVKNVGFKDAEPFAVEWLIDNQPAQRDSHQDGLGPMQVATFALKWKWQEGFHHVTVRVRTDQPEIAVINNEATDPLWAHTFTYVVSRGRVGAWHEFRSAYGTFCFEDFYRWHIDIMNLLFEHSVFPASPEGIRFRVRLDRIVYADQVKDNMAYVEGKPADMFREDGIRYDQGGWFWNDSPEELESQKWQQTDHTWRNQTEWSLPHELGHQLGLVDWYNIDYAGHEDHVWPDNREKVTHFQRYPMQMMHSHGQQPYGEADAGYLNMTIDKPRGHFGDYYFAIPRENLLHVIDINGRGVPDAQVEVFQRGVVVDPQGQASEERGVKYFPVIEDGNFDHPVSKDPVIVGQTNDYGAMYLPNRPVEEVRTLNGFHREPNPFGNINVVGGRGLLLVRVTKHDRPCHFWLEAHDFVVAWFRGQKTRYLIPLQTPYASVDSPPPPAEVRVEKLSDQQVKVTWKPPQTTRERNYLHQIIGYRVWRRVANDGLNDRPWFPVATLGPEKLELVVDLRDEPDDVYWYQPRTQRFGVTSLATGSIQSELVEVLMK